MPSIVQQMFFRHVPQIWQDYPELAAAGIGVDGITESAQVGEVVTDLFDLARARLDGTTESHLPEIQAWRRVFARMGMKPTQYRCAAESLLRRFRKDDALPSIHPLVDLLNAVSIAYAVPIAVFDLDQVADSLEVRYASGAETYLAFSGEQEHAAVGEVIFADASGHAHARRWTHRQSARSTVRPETSQVLIMIEAVHDNAPTDVAVIMDAVISRIEELWSTTPSTGLLTADRPHLELR